MSLNVTLQTLFLLFVSLFTLYSPMSNIGPYASLVGHLSRRDQRRLALSVFLYSLVVMLLFVWAGELLFDLLGVNSNSLRVTGGIALMVAGLPLMLGPTSGEGTEEEAQAKDWRSMAVIPMTFPMSIGGTTAAYIVSATGFATNVVDLLAISGVVALFACVILATHFFSPPLAAALSPRAREVLNRIGGVILVTISVQLLAGGIQGLFPGLTE